MISSDKNIKEYSQDRFVEVIKQYLDGALSEEDLYYWSCGFLEIRNPEPFLGVVWATIHQINETNPDYKTTVEELEYLYLVLKGEKMYSKEALQAASDRGIRLRFGHKS